MKRESRTPILDITQELATEKLVKDLMRENLRMKQRLAAIMDEIEYYEDRKCKSDLDLKDFDTRYAPTLFSIIRTHTYRGMGIPCPFDNYNNDDNNDDINKGNNRRNTKGNTKSNSKGNTKDDTKDDAKDDK